MVAKRHAPFRPKYSVQLGLRVKDRDPETGEVLTASCLFCQLFGRESKEGACRRPTDKVALFKPPFRKDSIQIHLVGQHPTRWAEYCALSSDDSKRAFFIAAGATGDLGETTQDVARPRKTQRTSTSGSSTSTANVAATATSTATRRPRAVVSTSQGTTTTPALHWLVNRDIVAVMVGSMMPYAARPLPEGHTYLMNAVADFEDLMEAAELRSGGLAVDATQLRYRVVVKDPTQFQQFVDYLSTSGSLTNTARMLYASSQPTVVGPFGDDDRQVQSVDVAKYARYLCAINFQRIAEIAKAVGVYSIGLMVAPMAPASFFQAQVEYCLHVQLRVLLDEEVTSFHLLSIPLNKRRSSDPVGSNGIFEIAEKALNAITPGWQDCMVAVVSDSDGITAQDIQDPRFSLRNAVASRFANVAKPGFLHVCSAARQLDSLMQKFFTKVLGSDEVYITLTSLLAYVSRQRVLLATMKTSVPNVYDNRWEATAKVAMWLRRYGVSIRDHVEREQAACAPPHSWWIRVMLGARIGQEAISILEEISGLSTDVAQSQDTVAKLRKFLVDWFDISGPLEVDDSAVAAAATRLNNDNVVTSKDGIYTVDTESALNAIEDLGTSLAEVLEMLQTVEYQDGASQSVVQSTVSEMARCVVDLVSGLGAILIEIDGTGPELSELPAVLPHELIKLRGRQFTSIIKSQKQRLSHVGWSRQEIDWIEQDFQDLCGAYCRESSLKLALDLCNAASSFQDAWGCLRGRFSYLHRFCGVMATAYPTAATYCEATGHTSSSPLQTGYISLAPTSGVASLPGNLEDGVSDLSVQAALQARQFRRLQSVKL
ncbi:unnamed protein product [Phytophthora lilii]|uniref:Unnamed protein product n=1 Tax=Phytophthora lilii TaxID=2077276 RepID=A0A9W6XE63_9STRA|nr:unnamed protein product [Phytophthora lilii]